MSSKALEVKSSNNWVHCHPLVPVTALAFVEDFILAGSGRWVTAYNVYSAEIEFSEMVLPAATSVHGFSFAPPNVATKTGTKSDGEAAYDGVVFGNKHVRVIKCARGVNLGMALPLLADVVKDARIIANSSLVGDRDGSGTSVVVGFAHNIVEIWHSQQGVMSRIVRVGCEEQCVLHSLSFHGWDCASLSVAAGTVMGELLVWNPFEQRNVGCGPMDDIVSPAVAAAAAAKVAPTKAELATAASARERSQRQPVGHHLVGHEGGVFCASWSSSGDVLISASDDRSVRKWVLVPAVGATTTSTKTAPISVDAGASPGELSPSSSSSSHVWELAWTGWGHTARVWKVACVECDTKSAQPTGGPEPSSLLVSAVSVSEDSSARVWNRRGECVSVLTGHAGRNLWAVAVDSVNQTSPRSSSKGVGLVCATAGTDGCIKLWPIGGSDDDDDELSPVSSGGCGGNCSASGRDGSRELLLHLNYQTSPSAAPVVAAETSPAPEDELREPPMKRRLKEGNRQEQEQEQEQQEQQPEGQKQEREKDKKKQQQPTKKKGASKKDPVVCVRFLSPAVALVVQASGALWRVDVGPNTASEGGCCWGSFVVAQSSPSGVSSGGGSTCERVSAVAVKGRLIALGGASSGVVRIVAVNADLSGGDEVARWEQGGARVLDLWFEESDATGGGEVVVVSSPNAQLRRFVFARPILSVAQSPPSSSLASAPTAALACVALPALTHSFQLSPPTVAVSSLCTFTQCEGNTKPLTARLLLSGDTKGNISAFDLSRDDDTLSDAPVLEGAVSGADDGQASVKSGGTGGGNAIVCEPLSVLRRAHGTHQVTVLVQRGGFVWSAGFDGTVNMLSVTAVGEDHETTTAAPRVTTIGLRVLSSMSASPVVSITGLHFLPLGTTQDSRHRRSIACSGFRGSAFLVMDVVDQYRLLAIECGGNRKPFALSLESPPLSIDDDDETAAAAATTVRSRRPDFQFVFASNDDGKGCAEVWLHRSPSLLRNVREYNLGASGMHGRELTCGVWCGGGVKGQGRSCLLTGGQDCLVKLLRHSPTPVGTRVRADADRQLEGDGSGGEAVATSLSNPPQQLHPQLERRLQVLQTLSPHPTSVRALAYSRHADDPSALAVSGGGKLALKFWKVKCWSSSASLPDKEEQEEGGWEEGTSEFASVELAGSVVDDRQLSHGQDQRILAIDAIPLATTASGRRFHLVATGDSNGQLTLFMVSNGDGSEVGGEVGGSGGCLNRFGTQEKIAVFKQRGPVLSMRCVAVTSTRVVVLSGSTTGEVVAWDVSPFLQASQAQRDGTAQAATSPTADAAPSPQSLVMVAHQMGANTIIADVSAVPLPCWLSPAGTKARESDSMLRVISGGDDQSIAIAHVLLRLETGADSSIPRVAMLSAVLRRVDGVSGSAIKGLGLLSSSPGGMAEDCHFVSVGYDQRLSLWRVHDDGCVNGEQMSALDSAEKASPTSVVVARRTCFLGDGPSVTGLHWVKAVIVDVSDVAGLSVSEEVVAENGEDRRCVRVAVFGQGIQVVELEIPR